MRYQKPIIQGMAVCLILGVASFASTLPMTATAMESAAVLPTQNEVQQELASLGFSPQSLAIIGLNATQTNALVTTAISSIEDHWEQLQSTRQSIMSYATEVATLKQAVKSGTASQPDHDALTLAQEFLQSAQSDLQGIVSIIRDDINQLLSIDQSNTIDRLLANSTLPVPLKYHVLDKTPVEWVYFRKAYAQCQTNSDPSAEAQGIVNSANADYQVNLAQVNLDTNLEAVNIAFHDAILANVD